MSDFTTDTCTDCVSQPDVSIESIKAAIAQLDALRPTIYLPQRYFDMLQGQEVPGCTVHASYRLTGDLGFVFCGSELLKILKFEEAKDV